MGLYQEDEQGNRKPLTAKEMAQLTINQIKANKKERNHALEQKALGEMQDEQDAEMKRLNGHLKKEKTMTEKDQVLKKIMDALQQDHTLFLQGTALFLHGAEADYEIKVTKKKERIPQLK